MVTQRIDELAVSRFAVEIEGFLVATFTECSGLSGEVEVETYQEGGLNNYEHKLPGRAKFGNLTLGGGTVNAAKLWDWFYDVTMGKIERRDISVMMYATTGEEKKRWNLSRAYPVRWQGPNFTAGDANVAVHSLELAHDGITSM